jgi:tRNA pseudouridine32 synthase/23S rRNA pseudouridine746 synthase
VLDKPAGLLTVPGRGADKQDCLATRAQAIWPDALVVHRLDKATSGLLLMARSKAAQRTLSDDFAQRRVYKRYLALVHGEVAAPSAPWGRIDLPIALDWPNRPLRVIDADHGKPSSTRWRILSSDPRWQAFATTSDTSAAAPCTRLELEPLTGRSHQLRVHLKAIGHPILGDRLYADSMQAECTTRLMLHAWQLVLIHPVTHTLLHFESPSVF